MKTKGRKSSAPNELRLELKYCERCGGLWLRPVGGGQVYCTACGRAMAELPPASTGTENARVPRGARLAEEYDYLEGWDEDEEVDIDPMGGAA